MAVDMHFCSAGRACQVCCTDAQKCPQVSLVDDIMMLHGMGIKLVLVLGAAPQINDFLRRHGSCPRFVNGHRVTDEVSMEAAMEAAGFNRVLFEALLSKVCSHAWGMCRVGTPDKPTNCELH